MKTFMYIVWFEDKTADITDEDKEWVACFQIKANNEKLAKEWGDHLSIRYIKSNTDNIIISSKVESIENYTKDELKYAPVVKYKELVTDDYIGW